MNLDDLHRDFEEHIELETRDNIERGMSPEEARAAALRKFGNRGRITEETYAVWHWAWMDRLRQDLRYSARTLLRQPGFAAVAILTLALGIGLNTAVFSVVNSVLLRPLPYPDADRLVWLSTYKERIKLEAVAGPDFFDWKQQARSFEAVVNYTYANMPMVANGEAEQAGFASVGDGFFAVTGARPALGRLFTTDDRNAVVLTHGFFMRRFNGDPGVVGKTVTLNGRPFSVCGVLPPDFRFVLPLDLPGQDVRRVDGYIRETMAPESQVRGRMMAIVNVVAKLKPGVPLPRARSEIEGIEARVAAAAPPQDSFYKDLQVRVLPMQERVVRGARRALMVLLAAVGFVLLIACGNVANLLLARAGTRQREIAIRAAIGAGRSRMIGQLLIEGILLAMAGGAAGLVAVRGAFAAIVRLGARAVPRLADATIDGRVLAFTLLLSLATGILFSLGPAISLSRANLSGMLRDGGRTASAGLSGLRMRRVLIAVQLALSVVLLTGAGLMLRSFAVMNEHPAGFHPDRLLTMKISLAGPGYRDNTSRLGYYTRALERLRAVPRLRASGIGNMVMGGFVQAEGVQFPPMSAPLSSIHAVSEGYVAAVGMRLVRGRWLTDREAERVVMVNEAFVRAVYGSADPIGRRIALPSNAHPGKPDMAPIVGVVGDLKYAQVDEEPAPESYVPLQYAPFLGAMRVLARVDGNPLAVAARVREAVAGADRTQPVYDVQTVEQALADGIAPRRFNLLLLGVFAAAALGLAIVGIYGVMSYAVAQRSQEIGVRMALGAQRAEVVRMVVRQGAVIAAAGIIVGVGAAVGLTRVMKTLLYGVRPTDPVAFTAAGIVLLAAALLACAVPALRAARVDPVVALRYE